MSLDEKDIFSFTWRVRNFSMCHIQNDESISSPTFKICHFENWQWRLELASKNTSSVIIYLRCEKFGNNNTVIRMKYRLCVLPSDGPVFKGYFGTSESKESFISFEDILKHQENYLPNDTLTILFRVVSWRYKNNPPDIEEMSQTLLGVPKFCIETTIPVQTKRVVWPIRKFQSISEKERPAVPVILAMRDIPSFCVTLSKCESFAIIEIEKNDDNVSKNVFVKCCVSVVNVSRPDMFRSKHVSLSPEVNFRSFLLLLHLPDLEMDEYLKHTEGVLYLQLDFAISIYGTEYHSEIDYCKPVVTPIKEKFQLGDFLSSSSIEDRSIVNLKSGDQCFAIHRSLLKARSEVFGAMFENDMREKNSGVVDITDVKPRILGKMLDFLYSNNLEDLPTTDLIGLYNAADKYQIKSLMSHCSVALLSSLDVSNVVEILGAADLLQDQQLLKSAKDIIRVNRDQVLVSTEWGEFMECYPSTAAKVLFEMLIK